VLTSRCGYSTRSGSCAVVGSLRPRQWRDSMKLFELHLTWIEGAVRLRASGHTSGALIHNMRFRLSVRPCHAEENWRATSEDYAQRAEGDHRLRRRPTPGSREPKRWRFSRAVSFTAEARRTWRLGIAQGGISAKRFESPLAGGGAWLASWGEPSQGTVLAPASPGGTGKGDPAGPFTERCHGGRTLAGRTEGSAEKSINASCAVDIFGSAGA